MSDSGVPVEEIARLAGHATTDLGGALQAKLVPNGLGQLEPTGYGEYVPCVRLKIYCDGGFSHESTGCCRA